MAFLLLFAAALKADESYVRWTLVRPRDWDHYMWPMLTCMEVLFAFWLVSGIRKRVALRVGIGCFLCFFCYSVFRAIQGEASCGCFGTLAVNPRITVLIDLLSAGLLWTVLKSDDKNLFRSWKWRLGMLGMAVLLAMAVWEYPPHYVSMRAGEEAGSLDVSRRFVVLEEAKWVGKRFPLERYADMGSQLVKGDWIILLYHPGCALCQSAIPVYEAALGRKGDAAQFRLALLCLDGVASGNDEPFHPATALHGRLSADHEWFATTPVGVRVHDGVVVAAASGEAAKDLSWARLEM